MPSLPLLQTHVAGYPCRRGKVRDVYDLGDQLVIVATDRLSAFDWVLPTGIPDKGRVLTGLTRFWLDFLGVPNHLLGTDLAAMGPAFAARADELRGRTCLVRKAEVAQDVVERCTRHSRAPAGSFPPYCGLATPRPNFFEKTSPG